MIRAMNDELSMKIVKLRDKWIDNVVVKHSSIKDTEQFKSMEDYKVNKLLEKENIRLEWINEESHVFKDNELIAKWSHRYHIEECEDGLKIKIESWIK